MELDVLQRVLAAFAEFRVEYVLIGGAALNVHGIVRATEDADIFLRPDRDNIGRLRAALLSVFGDPEIEKITAEDLLGDYPAVSYGVPGGEFQVDIFTRLGEAFGWEDLDSEVVDSGGVLVRVATPKTLYRIKRNTGRPKDRLDAAMLREMFDLDEEG